jgi:hypothetical protein
MQAVEQRRHVGPNEAVIRIFAAFGVVVATLMIIAALAYGAIAIGNAVQPKSITQGYVSPAELAFRAGEREALSPSSIQLYNDFRRDERGDGVLSAQQLQNQFRAGERGDSTQP